jgi:hypothetical protein
MWIPEVPVDEAWFGFDAPQSALPDQRHSSCTLYIDSRNENMQIVKRKWRKIK